MPSLAILDTYQSSMPLYGILAKCWVPGGMEAPGSSAILSNLQYNIPLKRRSEARVSAPDLSPTLGSVARPLR